MEKERQIKLLSIIALVVAIAGMTLGFAAFSTTLNISSSATVTPNSEDFKIVAYGLPEGYDEALIQGNPLAEEVYTSTTTASPLIGGKWNDADAPYNASIGKISNTNNTIVISNIHAEFVKEYENVLYLLKIKNEGQYDSYVNVETIGDRVCTSVDGEMTTLQEEACDNFKYSVDFADSSGNTIEIDNQFMFSKGDYMIVCINLYNYYGTQSQPDGAMDITFPDIKFTFSTTQ